MSVSLGVQNLPIFGQKCSPPPENEPFWGKIPSHLVDTFPVLHLFPTFPFRFTLVHQCFLKWNCDAQMFFWKGNVSKKCFLKRKCGEKVFLEKEMCWTSVFLRGNVGTTVFLKGKIANMCILWIWSEQSALFGYCTETLIFGGSMFLPQAILCK